MPNLPTGKPFRFACVLTVSLIPAALLQASDNFSLPNESATAAWEAEAAAKSGWRVLQRPEANGGSYVRPEPKRKDATLEFRFQVDRPTTIQVWPDWWIHGEQKSAVRFPNQIPHLQIPQQWPLAYPSPQRGRRLPFPILTRSGPDVIGALGGHLYFTAPDAGRVGRVDIETETLVDWIEIGGYPADLLVDAPRKRIYIADAANHQVVVLDAAEGKIVRRVDVPKLPWSLAANDEQLYVACTQGEKLIALDLGSFATTQTIDVRPGPQHIEVDNGQVVVWQLPGAVDPITLESHAPDRVAYWPTHPFPIPTIDPPLYWETLEGIPAGQAVSVAEENFVLFGSHERPARARISKGPKANVVNVTWRDGSKEVVDLAPLFANLPKREPTADYPETDFPTKYCIAADTLFFILPSAGRLAWLPLHPGGKLTVWETGGYLTDIKAFTGDVLGKYLDQNNCFIHSRPAGAAYSGTHRYFAAKVYVADAAGDRVIVFDPYKKAIVHEVATGKRPIALNTYGLEVFVACQDEPRIDVLDVWKDFVVRKIPLPARPVYLDVAKLQPRHTGTEFIPPVADDESPLRILLHYHPRAFDAKLKPTRVQPVGLADAVLYPRRHELEVKTKSGTTKRVLADNMHVLRFDNDRWRDVAAVTDEQRVKEPALIGSASVPGTIRYSMDGGPACNWTRDCWVLPDTRRFLVRGTDEFERNNAPAFHLSPGEHVLRIVADSEQAQLDRLRVWRTLERRISMELVPEPREEHVAIRSPAYQGAFAHDEDVKYALELKNLEADSKRVVVRWRMTHPLGGDSDQGSQELSLPAGERRTTLIAPKVKEAGIYNLHVSAASMDGELSLDRCFAKLAPLERPRLLYSADSKEAIRVRVAAHPVLFRRYRRWLERHVEEPGFLPAALGTQGRGYLTDHARWRTLACIFADACLNDGGAPTFLPRLAPLLKGRGGTTAYQGDFIFGSALAAVYDVAASLAPEWKNKLHGEFFPALFDAKSLHEQFSVVEDPLSLPERAVLGWQTAVMDNHLRYLKTHVGSMGGPLWQGLRTDCLCPLHSVARLFIWHRNFYRDPRFVEQIIWPGYFTYQNYALPFRDVEQFLSPGSIRGGGENPFDGDPIRLAIAAVSRHPLEAARRRFPEAIALLEGPLGGDEDAAFDRLMAEHVDRELIPLFLALGWIDPAAPVVAFEELPPSMYFDREGAASMKSDWSPEMTDIYFTSGVRDVSYRTQPNHLQIFKAGQVLLGTPSHEVDHGDPTSSWANAVVVGAGTPSEWQIAAGYRRMNERIIINRMAPPTLGYLFRDYRLSGILPESYGSWFHGGHAGPGVFDLILHSHTRHPFLEQGRIIAYSTHPDFDYVAGDATNVWPAEQVEEAARQVVYIRPNLIVVYDRLELTDPRIPSRWVASTAPNLSTTASGFQIKNQRAWLDGRVLSPKSPAICGAGADHVGNRKEGGVIVQNRLEIAPIETGPLQHYLVVMKLGVDDIEPVEATLLDEPASLGARIRDVGCDIQIKFHRGGAVGGRIEVSGAGVSIREPLASGVEATLQRWKNTRLYGQWMNEPRFRPFVYPGDLTPAQP